MRFVDTNILLYSLSDRPDEQDKARTANEILAGRDLALSTQVLQEFYVQATRPTRPDALLHEHAAALVESFTRFRVQDVDLSVVRTALELRVHFAISYWDAAIVAAAQAQGCHTLLSEDLGHGQDYGGVVVANPFLPPPA